MNEEHEHAEAAQLPGGERAYGIGEGIGEVVNEDTQDRDGTEDVKVALGKVRHAWLNLQALICFATPF